MIVLLTLAALAQAPVRGSDEAPERSVVGTLDQVDAPVAIVVKTPAGKQKFALEKGATIRQGSKIIKVSELAAHKGERVKVRYRDVRGVHRAGWVVVAAPAAPHKSPPHDPGSRL